MLKDIGSQTLKTTSLMGVKDELELSAKKLEQMKKDTEVLGRNISTKSDEEAYFQEALTKNTRLSSAAPLKVEVFQGDSFDVALHLKHKKGFKEVAVLNMANATSPGGGFLGGCAAQEESLCRRSTLFDSINIYETTLRGGKPLNNNPHLRAKMPGVFSKTYQIPEFGTIYSPGVQVFRGNASEGFPYYSQAAEVNVISSAAYCLQDGKPDDYREKTKMKLQMILNTALETNQEAVVLGAYGCGAFNNDPNEICEILKEILHERPIYQQKMKIVFAIISDSNDRKGNLQAFSSIHNCI